MKPERSPKPLGIHPVSLMVAIGLLVVGLQVAGFHDLRHDDAYITYRYGQNIAQGDGFVFNAGERIMGSTSPGHVLLSAALYGVTGKEWLPTAMSILGCVAWTAQAAALFFLLRGVLGLSLASLVSLCIALGAAQSSNWVALETNLAVALTLWALVLALGSRWIAAGVVCALAGLVRPDAYLVTALLGAFCLFKVRTATWRFALAFFVTTLPWLVFATAYFGTPLPKSFGAKIGTANLLEYAVHVLRTPAETAVPSDSLWPWSLIAWLVAGAGAFFLIRADPRLWLLPAYALLHLVAYLFLLPPHEHEWHLYPAVLVFVVLGLSALAAVGRLAVGRAPTVRFGVAVIALSALLVAYAVRTDRLARGHGQFYWFGARDAAYRSLSDHLLRHADPQDVVATYEIGTIGYYTEMRIHDWFGLVTSNPDELPPQGTWMVSFWPGLVHAGDTPPSRTFSRSGFTAYLFDLRRPNGSRAAPEEE
jgi:MFS family permease